MKSQGPRLMVVLASLALLAGGVLIWKVSSRSHARRAHAPAEAEAQLRSRGRFDTPAAPVEPTTSQRAQTVVVDTMKRWPDRLSTTAALPPFDAEAFGRDPGAYLSRVEPARCYQTLRPTAGARPFVANSDLRATVGSGRELPLLVTTAPMAPVTFTSFGGGSFRESGLSTVTVRADAYGLASVHFIANPGLSGDIPVVAGSPLATGNLRFLLQVAG